MRGGGASHTARRTAPRPRADASGVHSTQRQGHDEADEANDTKGHGEVHTSSERRPSCEFNQLAFTRADDHEDMSHRRTSVPRPPTAPQTASAAPPPLNARLLTSSGRAVLEEDLATRHPLIASPPEEALLTAQTSGPLVTEAWTRSVLKPGDEALLYEAALPAGVAEKTGRASAGVAVGTSSASRPGRRVLYRWSEHHADARTDAQTTSSHGSSARLWRYGVSTGASPDASVYVQLGRLGRLDRASSTAATQATAVPTQSYSKSDEEDGRTHLGSPSGTRATVADARRSMVSLHKERHVPRLFSQPSYQQDGSARPRRRSTAETPESGRLSSSSWGAVSLQKDGLVSVAWSEPFCDAGARLSDAERGTQVLLHTRDALLEQLRQSQERQGTAVTTEAYPVSGDAGGGAMVGPGTQLKSLLRADPSHWHGQAASEGSRRRRPNIEGGKGVAAAATISTTTTDVMTARQPPSRDESELCDSAQAKALARAVAYEPILMPSDQVHMHSNKGTSGDKATQVRVDVIAAERLVNDPFFPLTSEENYERLLVKNDEYEHRLLFRSAWESGQPAPEVSPYRPRYALVDHHETLPGASVTSSTTAAPSLIVAPFGYGRSAASGTRHGSLSPSADTSDDRPSLSCAASSLSEGKPVAIKLAKRKPLKPNKPAADITTTRLSSSTVSKAPVAADASRPVRKVVPTHRPAAAPVPAASKAAPKKSLEARSSPRGTSQQTVKTPRRTQKTTAATVPTRASQPRPASLLVPVPPDVPVSVSTTPLRSPLATADGHYASVSEEIASLLGRRPPTSDSGQTTASTTMAMKGALPGPLAITTSAERDKEGYSPVQFSRTPRRPSLDSSAAGVPTALDSTDDALIVADRPSSAEGLSCVHSSGRRDAGGARSQGSSPTTATSNARSPAKRPSASAGVSPSRRILADAVMPAALVSGGVSGGSGAGSVSGGSTPVRRPQRPAASIGYVSPVNAITAASASPTTVSADTDAAGNAVGAINSTGLARRSSSTSSSAARGSATRLARSAIFAETIAAAAASTVSTATAAGKTEPLPLEVCEAECEAHVMAAADEDILSFSLGPWEGPFPLRPSEGSANAETKAKREDACVAASTSANGGSATVPSKYADELRLFVAYYLRRRTGSDAEPPVGQTWPTSQRITTAAATHMPIHSRESLIAAVREDIRATAPRDGSGSGGGDGEDEEDLDDGTDPLDDGSDHERNVQCVLDIFGVAWQTPTLFVSAHGGAGADAEPGQGPPVVQAVEALFVRPAA